MKIRTWLTVAAAALATVLAPSAGAQSNYPDRPIRLIVPFPPGGTSDVVGRIFAEALGKQIGQPVVVENRGGAGGMIGGAAVAKAQPDGYTLMLDASNHAQNAALHTRMQFDTLTAFAPVSLLLRVPNVLVVNAKQSPFNTGEELINHARAKPDDLTYASFGNGSSSHLSAAAFTTMANIDVIHAPYRGSAPAMTDLLGGHISFMFDSMGTAITHINANTVRPLAVSGPERSSLLPEVPTFAELGLDQGYNVTAWFGFHVSSGTPTEIIDRLSQAMKTVSEHSEFVETFRRQGVEIISSKNAEYAEFQSQEEEKLGSLIKNANITLD